jgi:TPR repeat protein
LWVAVVPVILFASTGSLPRVWSDGRLAASFAVAAGGLLVWLALLLARSRAAGQGFAYEFVPVRSHYVQALVQGSIYIYWAFYWPKVIDEAPLILSQVVFLYAFDALLSWSRGRTWRLGFGPFPIVFSTNFFMWFRDEWFIFQFLMVALGALCKEFVRWERDGKTVHVFNPSAIALSVFSLGLILTSSTGKTWGEEVASQLGAAPYMYVWIFVAGLVVQGFFSVTLVTLAAAGALFVLNLAYTSTTGVYHFIDSNIPIAVFLGLHLLVTDPATSPKTGVGKAVFGALYGLGVFVLYAVLTRAGVPSFYDKLLVVPLLNLSVRAIDAVVRVRGLEPVPWWPRGMSRASVNLVHMALWVGLFGVMWATGFVQARHPGGSVAFWMEAARDEKPLAAQKLVKMLNAMARDGSAEAAVELGTLFADGELVDRDPAAAAQLFARACEMGSRDGCANAAIQFLFHGVAASEAAAARALDTLEAVAGDPGGAHPGQAAYLVGFAYATGRGRAADNRRAYEMFLMAGDLGSVEGATEAARMATRGEGIEVDLEAAARALEKACELGDAYSCMMLASFYGQGRGVPMDETEAMRLLERACQLGAQEACASLESLRAAAGEGGAGPQPSE